MAADHIGLICGAITGTIYAIINPDDDGELDNPRWLLIQIGVPLERQPAPSDEEDAPAPPPEREPLMLIRIPRSIYMTYTRHDEVQAYATETFRKALRVA